MGHVEKEKNIPIDLRWYQSITDYLTAFFSAMDSAPKDEVCTAVCSFDEHVVGVYPTTENNLVIDVPVNLSCPWSESTNKWMSNSSSRGSGNYPSISSLNYAY